MEAADGEAALALIERIGGTLDLLVTDCDMPNLNGTGLVRAMRMNYPSIPVIFISGGTLDSERRRLEDSVNACALVSKPFSAKQFLEAVRRMMPKSCMCVRLAKGARQTVAEVLPWLQETIAKNCPKSKYNVERKGGTNLYQR